MLALAPQAVRMGAAAAGCLLPIRELMPALRAGGVQAVSPNGVLGDPRGASAAEGRLLLTDLTAGLSETLQRLLSEVSAGESVPNGLGAGHQDLSHR
jgi:creatinine amidohydrolase